MESQEHANYDAALKQALEDPEVADAAAAVRRMLGEGKLSLADVGGFSQQELNGGYVAAVRMLEAGQAAKALQITGSLILLQPNDAAYHRLAGVACHHLGEYALADIYYRGAQNLAPNDATTMLYRGEVLLAMGEAEQGKSELQRGLAAASSDPALAVIAKRAGEVARTHGLQL
jgi:predicted Zn-dependent protease